MTSDQVLQIVILLFPVVSGCVAVLAKHLSTKLPAAQRTQAVEIINEAVTAIEQTSGEMPGGNKKAQAEALASTLLKHAGVSVSPETLDTLLEAAVFTLNQSRMSAATQIVPVVRK